MRQTQHSEDHDTRQGGLFEGQPAPIDFAPPIVRRHGYGDAHSRPLVGKTRGGQIVASFRVGPEQAWRYRYLELNPANAASVLVFDCDDPERMLDLFSPLFPTGEVPDPNWISWSARGRGHTGYRRLGDWGAHAAARRQGRRGNANEIPGVPFGSPADPRRDSPVRSRTKVSFAQLEAGETGGRKCRRPATLWAATQAKDPAGLDSDGVRFPFAQAARGRRSQRNRRRSDATGTA